jgi:XTP/dITP diphosphohydrolase
MADFLFVTSNEHKVLTAKAVCNRYGFSFERKNLDFIEIQSDKGEEIAIQKVQDAYQAFKEPVAITDDSWHIPGLRGFPGPYMKYINQWFKADDFLRLTSQLTDRRIIMEHIIVYKDDKVERVFKADISGTLLKESRGKSTIPHFSVISFDGGKKSVAETELSGVTDISKHINAWDYFCKWLGSN